jgi:hypothetical protein
LIEVPDILDLIQNGALSDEPCRYTDNVWFCVELRLAPGVGVDTVLFVNQVQIRLGSRNSIVPLFGLARALETRARALNAPLVAINVDQRFIPILKRRGYRKVNADYPENARQNWIFVPNHN